MNDDKFEQLKKDLNYAKMEGMLPNTKEFVVFRNSDEAIEAIRRNEVSGITWTEEDEQKYIDLLNKETRGAD
jgi:glutaredoxin-related protein